MKKVLLSIIAAVCCFTASAVGTKPTAGDGSKASPYQIATLENLLWFADYVNNTNDNASACAILTSDITMNTNVLNSSGNLNSDNTFTAWTRIGGHGVDYSGEFNGNGHTISGLYFQNTGTNNVGLFGKVTGNAYIHDLGVKDSYFYGHDHVGGICGDFASGRIENCWNGAYVMAHEYDAGGISGSCYLNASIANCYNIGIVSTYESKVGAQGVTQNEKFGGICGSVYNSSATYSIDNCYTLKSRSIPQDGDPYKGLPHVSGDCDKIYGFLVDNCPASKIHDSYVKNAEAFVGGEVCYRLNRGVTDGSQKWYQTLGSDLSPVLNNNRGTVYYGYDGDVLKYSNTTLTIPTTKHEQCAATCNARGYSQDCWEDNNSGKIYAEAACLHELNPAAVISYIPSADDPTYLINQEDVTSWTQEVNKMYDGVNFAYVAEKVFEDYGGSDDNYGEDEWVSFLVKEANAKNARLKWSLTGEKSKKNNGRYGTYTLTYKVGKNEQEITVPGTQFETSSEVYVLNLGNLSQNSVIEFHIKDYINSCSTPNEVIWAVTLEYVSEHSPQHVDAMAATCTEKGNYENWHCKKCDKHFANAECTTVMNDWEIPALGHNATHHEPKAATCTEDGNIEYWHCSNCNLNYREQACTNQITDDVVLPKLNHKYKQHQDYTEATCLTDGNIEYWHCPDCSTYFTNEACTASTTDYIIAALGHDFTYTPYRTSTCTSEGDVEHWHCNRCGKDFNVSEQMASEDHVISGSLKIPCKESDAIVVGMDNGNIYDDCHTFTPPEAGEGEMTVATVTFGKEMLMMEIKNGEKISYSFNATNPLETFFAHTFTLTANQDPDHIENYYSTFYTSECAYKLPDDGSVKAYIGTVGKYGEADVLNLTPTDTIHAGEAVILRVRPANTAGKQAEITLMPSCNWRAASKYNKLTGTDVAIAALRANDYALTLGQYGVGFYNWNGRALGAHKAYLTLSDGQPAPLRSFGFRFDDGTTTGIPAAISDLPQDDAIYNLQGQKVDGSYKGLIIKNGQKVYNH